MKKLLPIAVIILLTVAVLHSLDTNYLHVNIEGDEFEGPLGTLLGLLFAGGGLIIAAIAITCAAVFVGVLFAGIGILMVIGLALLAIVLAAVIAPFLLPLLIPVAIIWYLAARNRKQRERAILNKKEFHGQAV